MQHTMIEHTLQSACFIWHWNARPEERGLLYMNHNNPRDARQGSYLKALGMVKGVADMTYLRPRGETVFIEFKTASGRQSDAQKDWEKKVLSAGCKYYICKSLEHFKEIIGDKA